MVHSQDYRVRYWRHFLRGHCSPSPLYLPWMYRWSKCGCRADNSDEESPIYTYKERTIHQNYCDLHYKPKIVLPLCLSLFSPTPCHIHVFTHSQRQRKRERERERERERGEWVSGDGGREGIPHNNLIHSTHANVQVWKQTLRSAYGLRHLLL